LKELDENYFSISIDASNHKNIKLFPLIVRFFTAKSGVQVRLLDMESMSGEKATEIFDWINKILEKHHLKKEMLSSFCADNAPTNFGGGGGLLLL